MSVLGIDFSSQHVDLVLLADEGYKATWHRYTIAAKHGGSFQAARNLRAVFPRRSWFEDHGVWLVGIEEPYSHQAPAMVALGRIQGAIAALLPANLTVIQTPQSEWLKVFTGRASLPKGSADRKALAIERGRDFGFEADEIDAYDALGIACAVRAINEDAIQAANAA